MTAPDYVRQTVEILRHKQHELEREVALIATAIEQIEKLFELEPRPPRGGELARALEERKRS